MAKTQFTDMKVTCEDGILYTPGYLMKLISRKIAEMITSDESGEVKFCLNLEKYPMEFIKTISNCQVPKKDDKILLEVFGLKLYHDDELTYYCYFVSFLSEFMTDYRSIYKKIFKKMMLYYRCNKSADEILRRMTEACHKKSYLSDTFLYVHNKYDSQIYKKINKNHVQEVIKDDNDSTDELLYFITNKGYTFSDFPDKWIGMVQECSARGARSKEERKLIKLYSEYLEESSEKTEC